LDTNASQGGGNEAFGVDVVANANYTHFRMNIRGASMFCRVLSRWPIALLLTISALFTNFVHAAEAFDAKARQIWQLLDYVAVDYGGAVDDGKVLNGSEYAEMQEFAATAERQLGELPQGPATQSLREQAASLREAVANKATAVAVAQIAHELAAAVQRAYPFPVAPAKVPDLSRGAQLFHAQCASCHGAQGRGDGPLAATLDPKPTDLTDHLRAQERSLFALHQVLSNGVTGTAMPSFGALPDDDRWATAFFVGSLSYTGDFACRTLRQRAVCRSDAPCVLSADETGRA